MVSPFLEGHLNRYHVMDMVNVFPGYKTMNGLIKDKPSYQSYAKHVHNHISFMTITFFIQFLNIYDK